MFDVVRERGRACTPDCVWSECACVCVCVCIHVCERGEELGVRGQGREEDTKAKGKAAIKAQSAHPLPPISV